MRIPLATAILAAASFIVAAAQDGVPRWGLFEADFTSERALQNPLQDVDLHVTFTAPSRRTHTVRGFWDGGATWRVRFSPGELGDWTYATTTVPGEVGGLHALKGKFRVVAPRRSVDVARDRSARFDRHGPVGLSRGRTF